MSILIAGHYAYLVSCDAYDQINMRSCQEEQERSCYA